MTRRLCLLEEMEAAVSWDVFLALIKPRASQAIRQRRSSVDSFGGDVADPPATALVHASRSSDGGGVARYYGLRPLRRNRSMDGKIPEETTILNFRHLLEYHRIAEQILEGVNQMMSERAVMLREGMILDATNINAPSSS
jgi:transposase, IS5 family